MIAHEKQATTDKQACQLAGQRLRALGNAMDAIAYADHYSLRDIERIYELSFAVGDDPTLARALIGEGGDG